MSTPPSAKTSDDAFTNPVARGAYKSKRHRGQPAALAK